MQTQFLVAPCWSRKFVQYIALASLYDADGKTIARVCSDSSVGCAGASVKFVSVPLGNLYDADGKTIVIVCSDSSVGCTGASIVALQVWKK